MFWWIAAVAVVVVLGVFAYNRLVQLRNRVDNAWSQVDVQLKRRYDLIPNVVETVKGLTGLRGWVSRGGRWIMFFGAAGCVFGGW